MNWIRHLRLVLMVLVILVLSACNTSTIPSLQPGVPTPIVVRILDLDASLQNTPSPLPTFTPVPHTPIPSPTTPLLSPSGEPTTIVQIQSTPTTVCKNQAEFVKNLSIGDNAALKVEQAFVKIWQIRNTGTCVWSAEYSIVMVAGESMNAPAQIPLPGTVMPGETVDIRVDMIAPDMQGLYMNNWMFQNPIGERFGIGMDSSEPLVVQITVNPPPRGTPG